MDLIFGGDWAQTFVPNTPLLEIVVRGSVVYLSLFAMLRFLFRREAGAIGITDLLVIVLIADAAQNAMAGEYTSITDGVLLVAVILGWSYGLQWLAFHFPRMRPLVQPPPLALVKEGQMIRRNMRHELITEEEMKAALRLEGVADLAEVKLAHMESDGRISIIKKNGERPDQQDRKAA